MAVLSGQPARPWLAASVGGDVSDVVTTAISREGLPKGAAPAALVVGGGAAVLSAVLAWVVEE